MQFYRIPKVEKERLIWLARINGSDLRPEHVTDNTRLCSEHFHEGKKTKAQPLPVKFRHGEYALSRKLPATKGPVCSSTTSKPLRRPVCVKRAMDSDELETCKQPAKKTWRVDAFVSKKKRDAPPVRPRASLGQLKSSLQG